MFAKVFEQIFDSSIAEDYLIRLVFMDMLILADSDGVVDVTLLAISRRTNVPLEIVTRAIKVLSEPDPGSRTPTEEGRRLTLIDSHRDWGWRITNYIKYRNIRDEEARRIANRSYKQEQRAREKQQREAAAAKQQREAAAAKQQREAAAQKAAAEPPLSPTIDLDKIPCPPEPPNMAEAIFNAYPRRVGIAGAIPEILKALDRLRGGERQLPVMAREFKRAEKYLLGRVQAFASSPEGSRPDKEYIPYPKTWFAESRYLDADEEWNLNGENNGQARNRSQQRLDGNLAALAAVTEKFNREDADDVGRSQAGGYQSRDTGAILDRTFLLSH